MTNVGLFVWLTTLGLQLEILISQRAFDRVLIGPTEDLFLFIGAVPIQALLLVIWFMAADRSVHEDVADQISREQISEVGHTSEIEEVRGASLSNLINALRERIMISVGAYRDFAWRFVAIALSLTVLVLIIAIA